MKTLILLAILGTIVGLLLLVSNNVYGITVNNTDFSIDVPDNWLYMNNTSPPVIALTPNEFSVIFLNLNKPSSNTTKNEGVISTFQQALAYPIKNGDLDLYVKWKIDIDSQNKMNISSRENVTIDNEPAVKLHADGIDSLNGIKFVEYMTMHNKEPYYIAYMGHVKNFQKYLPQFEQMVKTFKFVK